MRVCAPKSRRDPLVENTANSGEAMQRLIRVAVTAGWLVVTGCSTEPTADETADTVYTNGRIYTVNEGQRARLGPTPRPFPADHRPSGRPGTAFVQEEPPVNRHR